MKYNHIKYYFSTAILLTTIWCCNNKQEKSKQVDTSAKVEINESKKTTNEEEKYILFFGNSLTAGYGLEEGSGYPELIQKRLDSLDFNYKVVNAGLSGETSAGGLGRIDWVLQQPVDVFVLELGANDALRGLDLDQTISNLRGILLKVREKGGIPIVIAGMEAPPNMGANYTNRFRNIFPTLAEEFDAGLIPFLLDGVAGIDSLNIADGIHPNERGYQIVQENVWSVLKSNLNHSSL